MNDGNKEKNFSKWGMFMEGLAEARAKEGGMSYEQELKSIKTQEKQRIVVQESNKEHRKGRNEGVMIVGAKNQQGKW